MDVSKLIELKAVTRERGKRAKRLREAKYIVVSVIFIVALLCIFGYGLLRLRG